MGDRPVLTGARRAAVCGLLAAVLLVLQLVMAPLPNIELVSPLILLYTLVFGSQVFFIIVPFVLVEGLLYGFGLWWFGYLYVWPLWALAVLLLVRRSQRPLVWAVACGAFGLCFGALFSIPYFFTGGLWAGVSYWLSGIPFDLLHCAGNFVLTLLVGQPLYRVLCQLRDRLY